MIARCVAWLLNLRPTTPASPPPPWISRSPATFPVSRNVLGDKRAPDVVVSFRCESDPRPALTRLPDDDCAVRAATQRPVSRRHWTLPACALYRLDGIDCTIWTV